MTLAKDIRRIRELLRPERSRYAVGLGSLFGVNASDVIAPMFMAVAVDLTAAQLSGDSPETPPLLRMVGLDAADFTIVSAVLLFLALHVLANALRYPMLMFTAVPSHWIGQGLRNRLVGHLLRLSQPFYDRSKSGDLMSLATVDINAARMMLGPGILVGADTLMIISLVLVVLFTLSWKLTLIAMIPLPFIALITNKLAHAEYQRFEAVQEDIGHLTERTRESYAGIRIIKGFAREAFDRLRFEGFSQRHFDKNIHLAKVRSIFHPTLDLMIGISMTLVLIFGGLEVVDRTLTLGEFVAYLFLVTYLSGPMIGFGWSVTLFQRGRASMHRLDQLDDEPIDIEDAPDAVEAPERATLEVHDLTFRYADTSLVGRDDDDDEDVEEPRPREPALRDVSFTLPTGGLLGIVGPVGCGKSTLAKLLVRLYDPPPGAVTYGGVDIREVTQTSLRRRIVLAPQDTFLFSNTVARNINLGSENLDEDPSKYAKLAMIHDEIGELGWGYKTLLGERGVDLSGGQRQRLAIARAIAADPDVLILDDCLSAVDARTEDAILANLRDIFSGRSGVIISHRVRAVQNCDEILVLEQGTVIERGTHDELVAHGGWYSRTAAEQMQEEA